MIPEISVQVPVKNGGEVFKKFLQSLARQDIRQPWELVIVDDGSDTSVQEEYCIELEDLKDICSLKVIRMDPGGNRPAARNVALQQALSTRLCCCRRWSGPDRGRASRA